MTTSARCPGLWTVILIKLGKGLLLLGLAVGVYSLVGQDLSAEAEKFARWLQQDPEEQFWQHLGARLDQVTPGGVRWVASGSLLYSVLLFIESVGLMTRAGWAVWLAIGETAFFIPVEIVELVREYRSGVLVILVVNALIVLYLARNRGRFFRHAAREVGPGLPPRPA